MHVAIVGLGFGEAFVPIYQAHPLVSKITICDTNPELGSKYPECTFLPDLAAVLADRSIDAVHLLTPLPLHAQHSVRVLEVGKHCACAVTMGNSLEEIEQVARAQRDSGLVYMMMETGVYTREFLFAQGLAKSGRLGNITLLKGEYFQDLEAPYPDYWRSVPPMHYATHCLGPMLALAGTRVESVSCVGAGQLRKDICDDGSNLFPAEVAMFKLEGSDAVAQVTRAWYQTARQYVESFSVYGDKMGFEWQQLESESPVVYELEPVHNKYRWRDCKAERTEVPFRPDLLPPELASFAHGGHGGSHAHLVHEFVSSVCEGRQPNVDAEVAANWCAAGIVAHQSALKGGEWFTVPQF